MPRRSARRCAKILELRESWKRTLLAEKSPSTSAVQTPAVDLLVAHLEANHEAIWWVKFREPIAAAQSSQTACSRSSRSEAGGPDPRPTSGPAPSYVRLVLAFAGRQRG